MLKRKPTQQLAEDTEGRKRVTLAVDPPPPPIQPAIAATGVTGFAFRITNISSDMNKDEFLRILNALPCSTSLSGGVRATCTQNVLGSSFAPSAASDDSEKYRTATVTFQSVPTEFLFPGYFHEIALVAHAPGVIVDKHFHGLTPLNFPEQPTIDIIAVTGLAGHAFGSWKSRGRSAMWLRDFLPQSVPDARILTYGYDSKLFMNNSTASIREFSRNFLEALNTARANDTEKNRPIIFIGHSLGGLVIKEALAEAAKSDGQHGLIFQSCYALLLFGVPNKGLEVTSLRSMVKGQPNEKLIDDLDKSSHFLRRHNHFWKFYIPENTRVVSIYETKPTRTVMRSVNAGWSRTGPEVLMVSRASAVFATLEQHRVVNQDDIFSIDANHSEMVKFDNNTCQEYLSVRLRIKELTQKAHAVIHKRCIEAHEMAKSMPGVSWNLVRRTHVGFKGDSQGKMSQISRWLSQIEYIKHHHNALQDMLEGTGQWLLRKKAFREWQDSKISSILWLHGIPGAGKTKLTCMVIETLESSLPADEPVVYFYCNRNEPERRDPTTIMQAIVKQLSLVFPGLPKPVVAAYDKRLKSGLASGALGFEESHILLVSLLDLYPQTTIIIDALDESDPEKRGRFLEVLTTIMHSSASLVKVFISSRDDIDIKLALKNVPNLYINARDNREDITRFIDREMTVSISNRPIYHLPKKLRDEVVSALAGKANGMFQWVSLQIKHLGGMRLEADVMENLGKLPKSLKETYTQILQDIREEGTPREWELTRKALMWIMCSRRLLSRAEWSVFSYWPTQLPTDGTDTLFELCRNLVTWDSQLEVVRFAHLSVHEFLESEFSSLETNSMATEFCLSMLDPNRSEPLLGGESNYFIRYWAEHFENSYSRERKISRVQVGGLNSFLGTAAVPSETYNYWFRDGLGQRINGESDENSLPKLHDMAVHLDSIPLNPLFAASYFLFGEEFYERWRYDGFDINCRNTAGETPLFVASMRGNQGAVSSLLKQGANVNAGRSQHGSSPLIAAMKNGHGGTVVQLLNRGASFPGYTSILHAAATNGCKTVMRAVLDRDCNINITEAVVVAAAGNLGFGKEIMGMLMAIDNSVRITEEVVIAVAGNRPMARAMMDILLARDANIKITEAAIVAAASNSSCAAWVMDTLLAHYTNIITEAVVVAAAGNQNYGAELMNILLAHDANIITEAVVVAAAGNQNYGAELMDILLAHDANIKITEAVVVAAAGNQNCGAWLIDILLVCDANIKITEAVIVAAACNQNCGARLMHIFLAHDANIRITEAVIVAVAGNRNCGTRLMDILLARNSNIKITEAAIVAAVGNQNYAARLIDILLVRDANIKITEAVIVAAACNQNCGVRLMHIFLAHDANIRITEPVVVAAASNLNYGVGLMDALLARNTNIKITEAVVVAAASNWGCGAELMDIFLARDASIKITEQVLVAVVSNWDHATELLRVLLARSTDDRITEVVMMAAASNLSYGARLVDILLVHGASITESVMVAVVSNRICGGELVYVLLARVKTLTVTKAVVVAAAGNLKCGKGLLDLLLANLSNVKFSMEAVIAVVRAFGQSGIKMLQDNNIHSKTVQAAVAAVAGH